MCRVPGTDRAPRGARGAPGHDHRGKREFDRQSGSDRTGIKPVDKREGGGAHNWGNPLKDDIQVSQVFDRDHHAVFSPSARTAFQSRLPHFSNIYFILRLSWLLAHYLLCTFLSIPLGDLIAYKIVLKFGPLSLVTSLNM